MGSSPKSLYAMLGSLSEILDYMKLPAENVVCTVKTADLQKSFFVSYEAVLWAMEYIAISSVEQAVELFNRMIEEKLIIHASGNEKVPFICGFYLYNIVDPSVKSYPGKKSISVLLM